MTLEELQDLADKDLVLDETNLSLMSANTPQLHNKYLKFLNKYKLLLVKIRLITKDKVKNIKI